MLFFFIESAGVPMAVIDENLMVHFANKELCEMVDLSKEELQKTNWTDLVDPQDLEKIKHYHQLRKRNTPVLDQFYLAVRTPNGERKEILAHVKMIPGTQRSLVSMTDATELKRLAEKLERKIKCQATVLQVTAQILRGDVKNPYQLILESATKTLPGVQAGSVLVEEKGVYVYKAAVGYDLSELSKVFFHKDELVQGLAKEVMIVRDFSVNEKLDEKGKKILEQVGRFRQIKVMMTIPVVVHKKIVGFFNLDNFEDTNAFDEESIDTAKIFALQIGVIFERLSLEKQIKKQSEQLRFFSYHDPLTELANRRFLEKEARRILALSDRQKEPVSLLYLDLNNFKKINDTFGHQTGDLILIEIAKRLRKRTRKSDFVARMGGDEFVFLLPKTSRLCAINLAKRIIEQIEVPIIIDNNKFEISASIGIAEYPEHGKSLSKILHVADEALYCAKTQNKPYCIFES